VRPAHGKELGPQRRIVLILTSPERRTSQGRDLADSPHLSAKVMGFEIQSMNILFIKVYIKRHQYCSPLLLLHHGFLLINWRGQPQGSLEYYFLANSMNISVHHERRAEEAMIFVDTPLSYSNIFIALSQ
jgi:hypothetical protein